MKAFWASHDMLKALLDSINAQMNTLKGFIAIAVATVASLDRSEEVKPALDKARNVGLAAMRTMVVAVGGGIS